MIMEKMGMDNYKEPPGPHTEKMKHSNVLSFPPWPLAQKLIDIQIY